MGIYFRLVSILLASLSFTAVSLALTDPVPNPFAALQEGEVLLEGEVLSTGDDTVTLRSDDGQIFTGSWVDIFKYREAAGPADPREFAPGDDVRFIGTESGGVAAVQSYDLLLCDQQFYGRVTESGTDSFQLDLATGGTYIVHIGRTTSYRDESGDLLFGYRPTVGDVLRVHGVLNRNISEVFTETLGAYVVLLPESALAPIVAEAQAAEVAAADDFTDVAEVTPFRSAIGFVKKQGIVGGYDDGTFRPTAEINRAEFAKILMGAVSADDLSELTEECFPDVPMDAWFAPFVCAAKEKGVIGGYPDGTFGPGNPVNLAEALKIIVSGYDFTVDPAADGEAWYQPFWTRAEKLQILPTSFEDAGSAITRGQMAELITRAVKYRRGDLSDYLDAATETE